MISSEHRFHGYASLKYVYRNGQIVRGPLFSVRYIENSRRKSHRIAVVVSRKVNKSAVIRNRIRRRLYEIVRLEEGDIVRPYDVVITVFHDNVADEPFEKLQDILKKQLSEAGVLAKRVKRAA